jgi:hypothetical protein
MKLKLEDIFEPHEVQKLLLDKARSLLYKTEWSSNKEQEIDLKVLTNILSRKEYPIAQQYVENILPKSPLNKKRVALERANKYISLLSQTYTPDSIAQTFESQGLSWKFTYGGNAPWPNPIKLMSLDDLLRIRLFIRKPFIFDLRPKIEVKRMRDYPSGWYLMEQFYVTIPESEKKRFASFLENENLP